MVLLLLAPVATAQDELPSTDAIDRAKRSTVFLMQTYEEEGRQVLSCVGSGTLFNADGLILTNAHLAAPAGPCRGERVIVSLPVRLDEPPVPTYIAEPVQIDNQLDLAVMQITGSLDGSLIDPATLNLPFVTIGDPSSLLPGDGLTFVGYPSVDASSIQSEMGVITGVTAERAGSRLAWLRTDSSLGGGMSGGGAYNNQGQLVGIPTSMPGTNGEDAGLMCLNIQDVTGDGIINERDACVPIGAPITAIRPVSFARSLTEAARSGFHLTRKPGLPSNLPIADPSIRRLFFATQLTEQGLPGQIVNVLPTGATSVFLFFDYDNMSSGIPFEVRVTRDGLEMPQFSLGPLAWGGGQKGMWYVGTEGKTWPDGQYEFTILLRGIAVTSAAITVGGQPSVQQFKNLQFGIQSEGTFTPASTVLPADITEFSARFGFEGMVDQQEWTETWYLEGAEIFSQTNLWDRGESGETTVTASRPDDGLPLGRYRLELYIGDRLAATGDILLAGNAVETAVPAVFSNLVLASDITREGQPAGQSGPSGTAMPLGVSNLYAFVDYDLMPSGATWTYRWFLDGRLVASQTQAWDAGGVGQDFWVNLTSDDNLPEGAYAVEVLVEGQPMFSANTSIGSGTQPLSGQEETPDEVFISGQVSDALTGEGIPGALVFVLDVAFESPDFVWNEDQIWTQAITDRGGRFEFTRGLPRGQFYTVYVMADGYITIVEDTFIIFSDQPSPADIRIEMTQP